MISKSALPKRLKTVLYVGLADSWTDTVEYLCCHTTDVKVCQSTLDWLGITKRKGDFDPELEELEDLARAAANKKQMAKAKEVVQAAAVAYLKEKCAGVFVKYVPANCTPKP
ncbi:hypothetical protein PLESTB_000123700 [Pleodorina starrii]|uniref:Uncharacterized protein n=1 Tax=Pleodorina starrii TaxID=330485 RepID=A0A9W6EXG7_9CHLO|nr:hypothetical protein PLESTB_000123700 [Pleodorina starrii]